MELATWLKHQGHEPAFVLGPVELERGMEVQNFQLLHPMDLGQLQNTLANAQLVIGNDSGPMHLAGHMGCAGLTLFGPAAAEQWGPIGLFCLQADIPCSPCTQTGNISCAHSVCMEHITMAMVKEALSSHVMEGK
jgi:ADP-heptose:LPS heptosyltransferase